MPSYPPQGVLPPIIEGNISQFADYSENAQPRFTILFPWTSTPTALANPGTLPTGAGRYAAWSPNGEYLTIAHQTSPFVTIYQRVGTTFIKLTNPAVLPTVQALGAAWSSDGQFMAIAYGGSPFIRMYQKSGNTFTSLAIVASGTGATKGAFSPNGEFYASAHIGSPRVSIYQRTAGTTFTKLADPGTLPTGDGTDVHFSPDGRFLAVGHNTAPRLTIYEITPGTIPVFTKLADPADLPAGNDIRVQFSPDNRFLSVTNSTTAPFLIIYQRGGAGGTTFTKLPDTNIDVLPPGVGQGCSWSPDGNFLVVTFDVFPFIHIYQRREGPQGGILFTKLANPSTTPPDSNGGQNWSPDQQFLAVAYATTPFVTIYQTDKDMSTTPVIRIREVVLAGT